MDCLLEIVGVFNSTIPKKSQNRKEPIQYINAVMECIIVTSPMALTGNKPIKNSPSEEKKPNIKVILINPWFSLYFDKNFRKSRIKRNKKMLEIIINRLKYTPNGLAPKSLIHRENKLIFG